jgi:hypothetical protein
MPLGADFTAPENQKTGESVDTELLQKLAGRKFLLTVGTVEPRKNHKVLIEAYEQKLAEMGYDVVIVGRVGWEMDALVNRIKSNPHYGRGLYLLSGVNDATLDALDQQNYERMYRYATEHGTSMKEARVAVNDKFIMNRLKMNEPGGYWAADVTCRGFGHETVAEFALRDVRYAFACSDGYAAAVSMGVVSSAQNMGDAVARGEGPELGELLRVAERQDSGCWRVHRSKISDDATYVLVRCQAQ